MPDCTTRLVPGRQHTQAASLVALLALAAVLLGLPHAQAPAQKEAVPGAGRAATTPHGSAFDDAVEAYIRFLPRLYMDLLYHAATGFKEPTSAGAPVNAFAHQTALADHTRRHIVKPNNDTLYASAWLDLAREPVVLHTPDTGGRYHIVQVLDPWTEVVASIGTRTTGNEEGVFVLAGPGWEKPLPKGLKAYRMAGNSVWVLARLLVADPAEVGRLAERALGYTLTPLSRYLEKGAIKRCEPPRKVARAPRPALAEQVAQLARNQPLELLDRMLQAVRAPTTVRNSRDEEVLARLERHLGRAQAEFRGGASAQPTVAALTLGVTTARDIIRARYQVTLAGGNGWKLLPAGRWGEDSLRRAAVAEYLLAANLPEDAVYPDVGVDEWGAPLTGAHRYVLHFDRGQLPPTDAFWSLTVYDVPGLGMVANPLRRYCLGSHRRGLVSNEDGSLDVYLQRESPGEGKEGNWLPTPVGPFNLTLRCFLPRRPLLDGSYKYPAVRRVE